MQPHRPYCDSKGTNAPTAQLIGAAESFPPEDSTRQPHSGPNSFEPRMPTEKQVAYAQRLAMQVCTQITIPEQGNLFSHPPLLPWQTSTPFPEEALGSFDAVAAFIDHRLREIPPSEKQARRPVTQSGVHNG